MRHVRIWVLFFSRRIGSIVCPTASQNASYVHYALRSEQRVQCSCLHTELCPALCNPTDCTYPWNFLSKNTRVGCHFLLQGIFLTQGSNSSLPHLLYWQVDSLPLVPPRLGERLKWLRLCGDHLGPCSSSQVEFSTGFSRKSSHFSAVLSHLAFGLWMRSEYHSKNSVAGWAPDFLPLSAGDGLQRRLTGARVWAPNSWDRRCTLGQLKAHLLNDSM